MPGPKAPGLGEFECILNPFFFTCFCTFFVKLFLQVYIQFVMILDKKLLKKFC